MSEEELSRIGKIQAARVEESSIKPHTFRVPPGDLLVGDKVVSDLTDVLQDALQASPMLIVDMNFDQTISRYGEIEILVAKALSKLAVSLRPDDQVLVLLDKLPVRTDQLALLAREDKLSRFLGIVDTKGNVASGFGANVDPGIIDLLRVTDRKNYEALADRLLRRRGVFEYSIDEPGDYYLFQYSARSCKAELQALFGSYFRKEHIDCVIYQEGAGSATFTECLIAAAKASDVFAASSADCETAGRTESELLRMRAEEYIRDRNARVALVVPAFKTGRTIEKLRQICEQGGRSEYLSLTVVLDDELVKNSVFESEHSGIRLNVRDFHKRIAVRVGGETLLLDYFLPVPLERLSATGWQVSVGKLLQEIEDPRHVWRRPTRVAMWSLMESYPAKMEIHAPPDRAPIEWFPALGSLDDWDAHWLAESLIAEVETALKCNRERLLIVMPDEGKNELDEENASAPISRFLGSPMGVAVASIPRNVIEGREQVSSELSKLIFDYKGLRIIVADESTIRYQTLNKLGDIVEDIAKRRPDLSVCVIEATRVDIVRPHRVISLCRWRPVRWGSRVE